MLATWGTSTGRNPTLDLQFAGATSLDNRITFSRGTTATLFDSTGALVYAPANLLLRSQEIATGPWFNAGLTSIANNTLDVVDPAGGNTATKIVATGTSSAVGQNFGTISNAVTGSIWLRTASGTLSLDLIVYLGSAPFTVIGTQTVTVTTTWQRFTVTSSVPAAAATYNFQLQLIPAATLYAWGGQVNPTPVLGGVTSSLTTYYPTTTAAYYAPRFDYNPSTLAARGLLIEEQRTNSIRNNTMQGAVAGTPGTLPTNWITIGAGLGTLTQQIVGTGISNGITYIDVRISGTTSTISFGISPESNTQISAASGQNWTSSIYLARVGGTTSNLTIIQRVVERTIVGSAVANTPTNITSSLGTSLSRFSVTRTLTDATTAFVTTDVLFEFLAGAAIDITLRIGLPQLEQGAFATSVIPTTTTALTRNADVASMTGTNFSSWFNAAEGTLLAQVIYGADVNCKAAFINNGAYTNLFSMQRETSLDRWQVDVFSGGSRQALLTFATNSAAINSVSKCASAYKVNDFSGSVNGGTVVTDTSGLVPVSMDRLALGRDNVGSAEFLNGWLQRISYYPVRLPNSTLQALTV